MLIPTLPTLLDTYNRIHFYLVFTFYSLVLHNPTRYIYVYVHTHFSLQMQLVAEIANMFSHIYHFWPHTSPLPTHKYTRLCIHMYAVVALCNVAGLLLNLVQYLGIYFVSYLLFSILPFSFLFAMLLLLFRVRTLAAATVTIAVVGSC